jgi:predicted RNase H-like HicB family nuclease
VKHHVHVALSCPTPFTFRAAVLNLPGVEGRGDSEEEAIDLMQIAFRQAIRDWVNVGIAIPWLERGTYKEPSGAQLKWMTVNGN